MSRVRRFAAATIHAVSDRLMRRTDMMGFSRNGGGLLSRKAQHNGFGEDQVGRRCAAELRLMSARGHQASSGVRITWSASPLRADLESLLALCATNGLCTAANSISIRSPHRR